jgi:branched-chain amino acid transport system ATP-binding protein
MFLASIWLGAGEGMVLLIFPYLLANVYQLDAFERGLLVFPSTLFAMAGGLIGGALIDRFSRENPAKALYVLVAFTGIGSIGQLILFLTTGSLVILIVGQAVLGFGGALTRLALTSVYFQVTPPNVRALGVGVLGLAELPLAIVFTPLAFAVASAFGYRATIALSIPFSVIGAIVLVTVAGYFEVDRRNAWRAAMASQYWKEEQAQGRGKLLVCHNIDVAYDGVQVLFDVSLELDAGQTVALLGTNGAGKSTVMRAIAGIQEASAGVIVFDGRDITHMPPHEIFGRGIVTVTGGRGIFPALTVRENLQLALWKVQTQAGRNGDTEDERLREVFEVFPVLQDRIDTKAGDLSGGEQQMLTLAQAFMVRPKLMMIDELSMGLAPSVVGELLDVVREINRRGAAVLLVEQSVNVAAAVADRTVFMEKGEVRFDGPTSKLFEMPDVMRAIHLQGSAGLGGTAARPSHAPRDGDPRSVLEVAGARKRYGGVIALDGVDLDVGAREIVALIGPNGSGKTTLFDVVSGATPLDEGTVRLGGEDVTTLAAHDRAKRGLVRRFQDARLFPSLTVYESLLVALDKRHDARSITLAALGTPHARRSERRMRAEAARLIELLDLGDYRDKFIKELSTGLRRITDIAIVLAAAPTLLLLDEPSTGIAQAEVENLAPLLRRARYETGCSMLIIEHDMPLVTAIADEVVALVEGRVLTRGVPRDVLDDPRVIEAYLGASEVAVERSGRRS